MSQQFQEQSKGFFGALFDFSFKSYITTKLIKVIFALVIVLTGLGTILFIIGAFARNAAFGAVSLIILGPLYFLVVVVIWRVFLEVVMNVFTIAENTTQLVRLMGGTPTSPTPPPFTPNQGWTPPPAPPGPAPAPAPGPAPAPAPPPDPSGQWTPPPAPDPSGQWPAPPPTQAPPAYQPPPAPPVQPQPQPQAQPQPPAPQPQAPPAQPAPPEGTMEQPEVPPAPPAPSNWPAPPQGPPAQDEASDN